MRRIDPTAPHHSPAGKQTCALVDPLPSCVAGAGQAAGDASGLLAPIELPFVLPTPIYGAMLAIWHLRPVLQRRFPLHKGKAKDHLNFLAWCASEGRRQYAALRSIPEWDGMLAAPCPLPELEGDRWAGGFSLGMYLLGLSKLGYSARPLLGDAFARHRIARAYWRGERHRRCFPPPAEWQLDFLAGRFGNLKRFIAAIRLNKDESEKSHAELIEAFGLSDIRGRFGARTPPSRSAVTAPAVAASPWLSLRPPQKLLRAFSWLAERLVPPPTEAQLAALTGRIRFAASMPRRSEHPFGVNLFGYAKGELGIGEDVRQAALALKAEGIPFSLINIKPGADVSQQDTSVVKWITDKPRYSINIFCMTGIELVRYACEAGLDVLRGRYNIGFWPWELPEWPASCKHAYGLVDEIWGISRYTAGAYRDAGRPVLAMPLSVAIDPIAKASRADFRLPEKDYLFIYSLDLNSTLQRKNPDGVIKAFQRAFPRSAGEPVGLVLKVSHVSKTNRLYKKWRKLEATARADPRIRLISKSLRRPQLLGLYRACDCYVSLHRAEGFGRSLAEALLLGLDLIATDFSGNQDFCTAERVGLVRCGRRRLKPGDYFHGEGQYWAEPDLDHAADLMRQIYASPRAKNPVPYDFSVGRAGAAYARRLREINALLNT